MAHFAFTSTASGTKIQVFPYADPPSPSPTPFFTAVTKPIAYTPTFPFSSSWLSYFGLPTQMIQPPNPAGEDADVIVKSEGWIRTESVLKCRRTKMCWVDMLQPGVSEVGDGGDGEGVGSGKGKGAGEKHWWPGMKRWNVGMVAVDAVLEVGVPEVRKV